MNSHAFVHNTDIMSKERTDTNLKQNLEREKEELLIGEIERNEKERVKKKGLKNLKQSGILDSYQCKS